MISKSKAEQAMTWAKSGFSRSGLVLAVVGAALLVGHASTSHAQGARTARPAQAAASPKSAQPIAMPNKNFVVVESRQGFDELQQAVDAIGAGRGTIRIASGTYRQCAVQVAGRISYVAAQAGGAIFEQSLCDHKAGLVLRGESARIDGVIFQDYRGAIDPASGHVSALAWDGGSLSIVNSLFRSSEAALLAHHPAGSELMLTISQSSFADLGPAGVDIGPIAKFRMSSSHFAAAPLAVRAVQVDLEDNLFEDRREHDDPAASPAATQAADDMDPSLGTGSATSPDALPQPLLSQPLLSQPLLSMPLGGVGRIQRNEFRLYHGARGSAALIAVALDEPRHPTRGLVIKDNRAAFADGASGPALFVADGSGDGVMVGDNQLDAGFSTYQRQMAQRP